MANESYDVVIVGGGMGGLNLAALLSKEGKRVLVLEKSGRDQLGGRASYLHAQDHLRSFYAAHGYVPVGDVFLEDDIPHVRMARPATSS